MLLEIMLGLIIFVVIVAIFVVIYLLYVIANLPSLTEEIAIEDGIEDRHAPAEYDDLSRF